MIMSEKESKFICLVFFSLTLILAGVYFGRNTEGPSFFPPQEKGKVTMSENKEHTAEEILAAARFEAFAFGRCCDLYQDGFGTFHCHECGQKTFAMLQGVQGVLGDGTEQKQGHSESICLALLRGKALKTAAERDALIEVNDYLVQACEKICEVTDAVDMALMDASEFKDKAYTTFQSIELARFALAKHNEMEK